MKMVLLNNVPLNGRKAAFAYGALDDISEIAPEASVYERKSIELCEDFELSECCHLVTDTDVNVIMASTMSAFASRNASRQTMQNVWRNVQVRSTESAVILGRLMSIPP
jgi:oligoribonuclease (3'-5' exoribonuclease)